MKPDEQFVGSDESLDTFYRGRILVLQKKRGYRFSIDAPLLANFIRTGPGDELLEMGAGSGIISLLLSIKPFRHITAVEIQPALVNMAERSIRLNGLENRITLLQADLRLFNPGKKFDVVFSNPPYIAGNRGRLSRDEEKSIAKHELKCNIFDIMRRTGDLLMANGKSFFIFPAHRRKDFTKAVHLAGLHIQVVREVRPRRDEPANFFLFACGFQQRKVEALPPLVLFKADGTYTDETENIFSGRLNAENTA
ncbi:MAG: methyltransferase [Candidatus Aminicenantes bacterium]|nr:methyltransferase [Candidatus Aminicenantes bacterium]